MFDFDLNQYRISVEWKLINKEDINRVSLFIVAKTENEAKKKVRKVLIDSYSQLRKASNLEYYKIIDTYKYQ